MITWSRQYSNGAWMVDDYHSAKKILSHDSFSCQRAGRWVNTSAKKLPNRDLKVLKFLLRQSVAFIDGQKHRQLRSLLIRVIKDSLSNNFEAYLTKIVDSSINSILDKPCDVIENLAKIVPAKSIAYLMGVDPQQADLSRWCDDIANFIGAPIENGPLAIKAQKALSEMSNYFELTQLNSSYVKNEGRMLESLIQEISQDSIKGKQIILAQLCTLLFGAYETTCNLIGNSLYLLCKNKAQFELLYQQPALIDRCIQEALRLESPVQYTGRITLRDTSFGGITMRAGDLVIINIASANRDATVFSNPSEFIINRDPIPNLAFGHGRHYCLGSTLSQMECRMVLSKIINTHINQCSQAVWSSNTLYRGLTNLAINITMKNQ